MDKRTAILEAAARLFAEKGFTETSAAEVASAAGVAQGTIFYHFKTKDGILLAVYQAFSDAYATGLAAALQQGTTGLESLEAALRFHLRFVRDESTAFLVVLRDLPSQIGHHLSPARGEIKGRIARILALFQDGIERGIRDGSLKPPTAPAETAILLRGLLFGLTRQKLLGPMDIPELDEQLMSFCRQALGGAAS